MNIAEAAVAHVRDLLTRRALDPIAKELRAIAMGHPVATRSDYRDGSRGWDKCDQKVREAWREEARTFIARIFEGLVP